MKTLKPTLVQYQTYYKRTQPPTKDIPTKKPTSIHNFQTNITKHAHTLHTHTLTKYTFQTQITTNYMTIYIATQNRQTFKICKKKKTRAYLSKLFRQALRCSELITEYVHPIPSTQIAKVPPQ